MSSTYTVHINPTPKLNIKGVKLAALQAAMEFFCDEDESHYSLIVDARQAAFGTSSATVKVTYEKSNPAKHNPDRQAFASPALN